MTGGKGVETVQQTVIPITTDALELMVQQTQLVKELTDVAKELTDKLDDLHVSMIRPALYTTEEVAVITGIAEGTLRKYHCEGLIGGRTPMPPSVKIGDKVMYSHNDLMRWIAELPRFTGRKGKEV
jgi:hypothetical protein